MITTKFWKSRAAKSVAVVMMVCGAAIAMTFFTFQPEATVTAANFDLTAGQLPINATAIEITLNREISASAINADTFKITPFVEGVLNVQGNTLSYVLSKPLQMGEKYRVVVSQSLVGQSGEWSYQFTTTSPATVTAIFPQAELTNLAQPVTVVFSTSMVPLTALSTTDKIVCPVTVTPTVAGRCRWVSRNILEFQPDRGWNGATKYDVKVTPTSGLTYPFSAKSVSFTTPALTLEFANTLDASQSPAPGIFTGLWFRPDEGIIVRANYPVNIASLARLVTIDGKPAQVVVLSGSTREYIITPSGSPFRYEGSYHIAVAPGVLPQFGTIATTTSLERVLRTAGMIDSVETLRNVLSSSGVLLDTVVTDRLATKNAWIRLSLAREIPLASVSVETADGKKILTKASYVKEEKFDEKTHTGVIVENRARIRIDISAKLSYDQKLAVVIDTSAHPSLQKALRTPLEVVATPSVTTFTPRSATKACLTFATPMEASAIQEALVTTPAGRISSVMPAEWDYDTDRCPENSFVVNWRLAPATSYAVSFSGLTDIAGSSLAWKGKYRTPATLSEKDKYLYLSWARENNTLPQNVPLVLNLQTMNTSSVNVEVCETDFEGYRQFLSKRWSQNWSPTCSASTKKTVSTKLKYWTITNNRIDLEKDILGRAVTSPYLIVRGSVGEWNLGGNYRDGQKEFIALIVRSGLSVALESGADRQLLYVTDLAGNPVTGKPDIQLYNWNANTQSVSQISQKDAGFRKGTAEGVWEMSSEAEFVQVTSHGKFALLDTSIHSATNYDFKYVSGQDSSAKDFLFLYPDRPIYKPGDTVFFKGLLRRFHPEGYTKSSFVSGTVKVTDSEGSPVWSGPVTLDKNSNFTGKFILPEGVSLGNFVFHFDPGNGQWVMSNGSFSVERYVKPAFKLNATVNTPDLGINQTGIITLAPEYYFGGKITGVAGKWQTLSQDYFFDAKEYADWQFGQGSRYWDCVYWDSCNYEDTMVAAGELAVGFDGIGHIESTYTSTGQAEKIYSTTVTVADPATSRSVSQTVSQVVHTTDGYVGLKVPYWNPRGQQIPVDMVTLDWNAQPKANAAVTVTLTRHTWMETRKQGVDGAFYSEWALQSDKESSQTLTTDARGLSSVKMTPKSTGEYEIRAQYFGANHQVFESVATVWIEGDADASFRQSDNSVTDLVADTTHAKVGETVGFTLMTPTGTGTAFFTVEKDDAILSYFTKPVMGPSVRVELPITSAYLPNVYLKAFTVGTASGAQLPVYKRGLAVVKVDTTDRQLIVKVTPDSLQTKPGQKITATVTVTDINGKPVSGANGSLAVVDESVLALKGNPVKNPYAFFYDMKRYLGVNTSVSLLNLVQKLEVKDTSDGEKGGAGDQLKGGANKTKRGVFKDTAFWSADFVTGADGTVKITTDALPDNLTTWNLEAVVNVTAGNFVGVGSAVVTTQQSVMITENLPRVLGAGDTLVLAPSIANRSGISQNMTVTLTAAGIEVLDGVQKITLPEGGNLPVSFHIKVPTGLLTDTARQAKITFEAVSDTGDRDAIERYVPIVQNSTLETVATVGYSTGAGVLESVNIASDVSAVLTAHWAATPLAFAPAGLDNTATYAEASAWWTPGITTALATKDLYDALALPYDFTKKIVKVWKGSEQGYVDTPLSQVISEWAVNIRDHQLPSGGFSWEPSDARWMRVENIALSSEVAQDLKRLQQLKFSVDSVSLQDAANWFKNTFYAQKRPGCSVTKWNDCRLTDAERRSLLRGYLVASDDVVESLKMLQLLPVAKIPQGDELETMALVAAHPGLSSTQRKTLSAQLTKGLLATISNAVIYNARGAFVQSTVDRFGQTARFVRAISLAEKATDPTFAPFVSNAVRWLVSESSTLGMQDTVAFAQATAAFTRATAGNASGFTTELRWNSERLATQHIDASNKLQSWSTVLSGAQLGEKNTWVAQVSGGSGTIWYDLALSYVVPSQNVSARDEGFTVVQNFYDYNEYKRILALQSDEQKKLNDGTISWDDLQYPKDAFEYLTDVTEGSIGQLLVTRVRLVVPESRDGVRFDGFVPAGAELVNPNLATEDPATSITAGTSGLGEISGESSQPSEWSCVWCGGLWNRDEYRDDCYVGFAQSINPGIYTFGYVLRLTHAGTFAVRPSSIVEIATPEVFGRSAGVVFTVK